MTKKYVKVNTDIDADGKMRPVYIVWDDGRKFEIDYLKNVCYASSTKVGGCGLRYTVIIHGKETYLFFENNKWFVESRM